jgi:hypothetical protein
MATLDVIPVNAALIIRIANGEQIQPASHIKGSPTNPDGTPFDCSDTQYARLYMTGDINSKLAPEKEVDLEVVSATADGLEVKTPTDYMDWFSDVFTSSGDYTVIGQKHGVDQDKFIAFIGNFQINQLP